MMPKTILNTSVKRNFSFFHLFIHLLLVSPVVYGQGIYFPPDFYEGQLPSKAYSYYENKGQIVDANNILRPDIKYHTKNAPTDLYFFDDKLSFAWRDDEEGSTDAYRIDMFPLETQTQTNPKAFETANNYLNFYLPHCKQGITHIYANAKIVYLNIFEGIDLHVYSNGGGPKFFYVIHPGANPNNLKLKFVGQDNLNIVNSDLELYLEQEILEIPEGVAFEADILGNMSPSSWTPTFINQGNGEVAFTLGSYNPSNFLVVEIAMPTPPSGSSPTGNNDWTTFYGGINVDDFRDVTTNKFEHNAYVTGLTNSNDFPNTTGLS